MAKDPDRAFFGHPAGLKTLFFTEMWERLSYYGSRAFLAIYMTTPVTEGGRGMSATAMGLVMALYMSSVYLLSLPGGWIADRFLGQRKAVVWGGVAITLGSACLAMPIDAGFYPGLALVAIGTGLLKPNISTLVGQLYSPDDKRRDAGFTIYYMGINIGAAAAPLVGMFIAEGEGFRALLAENGIDPILAWRFAFAVPAVGMLAGLIQYRIGWHKLGEAGLHPTVPSDPKKAARDRNALMGIIGGLAGIIALGIGLDASGAVEMSKAFIGNVFGVGLLIAAVALFVGYYKTVRNDDERRRVTAMIPLFLGAIGFFGVFEQASTTLSLYAKDLVHRDFLGLHIEASAYQFPNAIFIILLASPFAWLWLRLAKSGKEPSSVTKFGIGMVLAALSFAVLIPTLSSIMPKTAIIDTMEPFPYVGDMVRDTDHLRVSPGFLILLYLIQTMSELCISPVGLSSMSKLAPTRVAGMVMGTWFLATAIGNYLAGRAAGFVEARGYEFLFTVLIVSSLAIAAALFVVSPRIRRMLAASSAGASAPPDRSEKAEPDPLPAEPAEPAEQAK